MDRQQQIPRQRHQRHVHADIGAGPHPGQNQQGRQPVATMVDKIAIGGPLDLAKPGQAAIHRIAEPLQDIATNGEPQPMDFQAAGGIAGENGEGSDHAEHGQNIWRHP